MLLSKFIRNSVNVCRAQSRVGKFATLGFTLIELLVVISIIGLLSSVTLSSMAGARMKADDAKRSQELAQVKIALELYLLANNSYPTISFLDNNSFSEDKSQLTFGQSVLGIFTDKVYAQSVSQGCDYFNQVSQTLINRGFMKTIPRDPKNSPSTGVCYKAWSDGNNIAVYTYLNEKYATNANLNKKIGFVLSKNSEVNINMAQTICTNTSNSTGDPFPVISPTGSGGYCTGTLIADKVLGFTSGSEVLAGGGVITGQGSCSDPQYTNQASCIQDRSYCSDPQYTDQSSCEGAMCGGSSASCSDSNYYDESSCTNAMCTTPDGYVCTDGSITDQFTCENAQCTTTNSGCSNPSYSDQLSCEGALCTLSNDYCDDPSYGDQYSCESNGYSWNSGTYEGNCGYSWSSESTTANCGYSWSYVTGSTNNCGYTWQPGTESTPCGNTWSAVSGGIWTP